MSASEFVKVFRVKSHELVFILLTDEDDDDVIIAFCRISGKTYENELIGVDRLSDINKELAVSIYNSLIDQLGDQDGDIVGGDTDS